MTDLLRRCRWIACGGVLLAALAGGAEMPPEVVAAVRGLVDPDPQVREEASRKLWRMGRAAEPALQRLANAPDPELSGRARQILIDIAHGITPDTPPDIVALLRGYQRADVPLRREMLKALTQLGRRAMPYLVRLSKTEQDPALRDEIVQRLSLSAVQAAPAYLLEGEGEVGLRLLEELAAADADEGTRALAAWLMATGSLDQRIVQLRQRLDADPQAPGAQLLLHGYRIKGDLAAARTWAGRAGRDDLLDGILAQQGDFAALARRYAGKVAGPDHGIETIGLLSMSQRLCSDAGLEQTLRIVADMPVDDAETGAAWAELLLLNGRPDAAIPMLLRAKSFHHAFDLLAGQHRYAEAMALADGLGLDRRIWIRPEVLQVKAHAARILCFLGETARGEALFDELGEGLMGAADFHLHRTLIKAARDARQQARALRYCADALSRNEDARRQAMLLEALYPGRGEWALAWRRHFAREHPAESAEATLQRVNRVLMGKLPAEELEPLARRAAEGALGSANDRAATIRGIADTLEAAGRIDVARELLLKLVAIEPTAEEHLRLGAMALQAQRWDEAAEHYSAAIASDSMQAAPHYLRGHALVQAGRVEEGRKAMELGTLLPLADPRQRFELAEALRQAGLVDAAEQQYLLVARTASWMTPDMGNALRYLSRIARQRGDWKRAAEYAQLSVFDCIHPDVQYSEFGAYLAVPASIHRFRAAGLLGEGKIDAALEQIEQCLRILPGEISIAIDVHAPLVKAGRAEDARRLVERILAHNQAILKDHPRSASLHNAVAWMLARCGLRLDEALEHARKGVELEPKNVAIIDTLAEVYFQLGQKEKAIETIQRCITLEPHEPRHKLALARFQTSTPDTDPPPEE